jgi:hypothetical protein
LLEDTAADARARLDQSLLRRGQECTLQRVVSGSTKSVALRAAIREYKPDELFGDNGLMVGDSHAVISATEIIDAKWPSKGVLASTTAGDPRIPIHGDKIVLSNGRVRVVKAAWPASYIDGELVRIEMNIR